MLIAGQQNRTTEDRCFRKNRCVVHFGPRKQTNKSKSAANLKGDLKIRAEQVNWLNVEIPRNSEGAPAPFPVFWFVTMQRLLRKFFPHRRRHQHLWKKKALTYGRNRIYDVVQFICQIQQDIS